jgi:hypothetical protein
VPRSKNDGAISSLPHTSPWLGGWGIGQRKLYILTIPRGSVSITLSDFGDPKFKSSCIAQAILIYRMSQVEKSVFWEVILSVIWRKKCICTCVLFRTVSEIELFHCTVRKIDILRSVSNTGIHCSSYKIWYSLLSTIHFQKFHRQHQRILQLVWGHGVLLVCTVYSTALYSEISLSRKPFGIGHMYIYSILHRMTDNVAFQNIDVSSWDILYTGIKQNKKQTPGL